MNSMPPGFILSTLLAVFLQWLFFPQFSPRIPATPLNPRTNAANDPWEREQKVKEGVESERREGKVMRRRHNYHCSRLMVQRRGWLIVAVISPRNQPPSHPPPPSRLFRTVFQLPCPPFHVRTSQQTKGFICNLNSKFTLPRSKTNTVGESG